MRATWWVRSRLRPGRNRGRYVLVAVLTSLALVAAAVPAMADGPGGPGGADGGGGGVMCDPNGGFALAGMIPGYPTSWTSTALGLTLPPLDPQLISTDAVIAPGPGEDFPPIHLIAVKATPMAKVLKNGTVDPHQAVMEWMFRVQQVCPDTGTTATCDYWYHEMPGGGVFEIATGPDGQPLEHMWRIACDGAWGAFRAPGAPQDLGARLLAAAKANVGAAQINANATGALASWVVSSFAAAGAPPITLPASMLAWGNLIAAVVGTLGTLAGSCGGYFASIVSNELGVWTNLLSIPTADLDTQIPLAGVAVWYKGLSSYAAFRIVDACLKESGPLAEIGAEVAALGLILWWSSTVSLAGYGITYAISYWLNP